VISRDEGQIERIAFPCGILVQTSESILIKGNTCRLNGGDGIRVESKETKASISGNFCLENERYGLSVSGKAGIWDNYIRRNGFDGIFVDNDSRVTLANNDCALNRNGICISSAEAVVVGNRGADNHENGLKCEGGSLDRSANSWINNRYYGVSFFAVSMAQDKKAADLFEGNRQGNEHTGP
jgi:parallel beta-helix repeat protein